MNTLARALQVLLGLWLITGGAYLTQNHAGLTTAWASDFFPSAFWIIWGAVEIILGVGLIATMGKKQQKWASILAILSAILVLLGLAFYSAYAGFPGMLWGIAPALLLLFVAIERKRK